MIVMGMKRSSLTPLSAGRLAIFWTKFIAGLCVAGLSLALLGGCQKAVTFVLPSGKIIDHKVESNLLGSDQIHVTVRNVGVAGKLVIKVTQETSKGHKEWQEIAYFSADEQRLVSVPVDGIENREYEILVRPE